MRLNRFMGVSALALAICQVPVLAQTSDPVSGSETPSSEDTIVVTGIKASLGSAQAIKKNADQIVDSVQATDIGKLPDANTTEALQRITGVQIQRRYGEGATDFDHRTQPAVTVRGLTGVQSFLDGRAIYSASGGRAFDVEGLAPEILAGIDVYKNAPANIIEGGIGAAINLRTRKPFDSNGQVISLTGKLNYYDRVDKFGGSVSGLYSNRFETGAGEIGILINAAYSESSYRQDGLLTGVWLDVEPGTLAGAPANAKVPDGFEVYDDKGKRRRLAIASALQWQATPNLLLTAQYQFSKYWFDRTGAYYYEAQKQYDVYDEVDKSKRVKYGSQPDPATPFTWNSEGYATSGALRNQVFETGRFDQELWSASKNATLNAAWNASDRLKINLDAQYLRSYYNADRNGHVLSLYPRSGQNYTTAPDSIKSTVMFDLRGKRPQWDVKNPLLLASPNNYYWTYVADSLQRNDAESWAFAGDFDYAVEGDFLKKLRGGLRYADTSVDLRGTWNGFCIDINGRDNTDCKSTNANLPVSSAPQVYMQGPSPNWFDGNSVRGGLVYPAFPKGDGVWAQTKALYALIPGSPKVKDFFSPGDLNRQTERTYTGWAVADYEADLGGVTLDGNVGVRLVKTQATSVGTQFNNDGTSSPLSIKNDYFRALPSFNLRARFSNSFQARFAYSKGVARPNFDQLSTNLSLDNPNQLNSNGHANASAGNPYLKPIETDNFDLTAEWYFAPTGSLTAGLFYKKVRGFLASGFYEATVGGVTYDVKTQVNLSDGTVKGLEVGYQQFFDFLPGILSGLGLQANYTFVDSSVQNPFFSSASSQSDISATLPLEKLSKHSYNIVGLYEKGPVQARLAWNWRSSWLSQTSGSGANGRAQYERAYGSLDASVGVNLTEGVQLSVDAVNLLNRMGVLYLSTPAAPLQYQLNDRRFGMSLRATF